MSMCTVRAVLRGLKSKWHGKVPGSSSACPRTHTQACKASLFNIPRVHPSAFAADPELLPPLPFLPLSRSLPPLPLLLYLHKQLEIKSAYYAAAGLRALGRTSTSCTARM
ncbi:hypothetical protein Vafri_14166 [Volvox africanus]|uniref:Uncharacterized protein n=1 Tax=Volvox africanus TaxID=51714 RepID=A0A8J4F3G7_9CHLO|nr:hypothetical protein Vafri_14166 [Volvox africanus]